MKSERPAGEAGRCERCRLHFEPTTSPAHKQAMEGIVDARGAFLGDELLTAFEVGWEARERYLADLASLDPESRALYDALMARLRDVA